ncbi:MAG: MFS transporter, partial [Candidatus Thorarchaeota archaeon]
MTNLYHRALSIGNLNSEAKQFISRATSLILTYSFVVMLTNTFLILQALEFVTLTELAMILAIQFVIQSIASYPAGAIGDWIGQRWVLFTAAISYGIGFIVISQAIDFLSVAIAFILVAFAQSQETGTYIAWFDTNYKIYTEGDDKDRRTYSQFYGKFTMFQELLTAFSFILGGILLSLVDRQMLFLFQGFLLIAVSLLLLRFIQDHKDLKREKRNLNAYFRYLRGGLTTAARNRTLRLMILGLMISGAGWAIWGGLILFPLYASYAFSDTGTALLRSSIFILGALCVGLAGTISKRIGKLQKWLAIAVFLTDFVFFIGMYIMLSLNPAPSSFMWMSLFIVILTFTLA